MQLETYISFLGYQDDIYSILQNMNIGLMCSRDEAFGRVTIEYMQNRLPVIASNAGANPELIQANKNGFLYEIYNPDDLTNKILFFLENPEKLEQIGQYAQQYALENFSSEKNTREIYQLIQKTINN